MARRFYEQYATAEAIKTYLQGKGWTITEVKKGFESDDVVTVPTVSIYFSPSSFEETQLARTYPSFNRRVQVDAYMEDEPRADSIGDDIMDFFDTETVSVVDPSTAEVAVLRCIDSTTITGDTLPPNFAGSSITRWRSVVKATVIVDYLS